MTSGIRPKPSLATYAILASKHVSKSYAAHVILTGECLTPSGGVLGLVAESSLDSHKVVALTPSGQIVAIRYL